MKKFGVFVIVALAMVSCGNTYSAKDVTLASQADSLNYAVGLVQGYMLRMQEMQEDSSDAVVKEFMNAVQRGYDAKEKTEAQEWGYNLGVAIKAYEKSGLAEVPSLTMDEKVFFQAFINALNGDTTQMNMETAMSIFQSAYMMAMYNDTATTHEKAILAILPSKVKTVELVTKRDTINYAFGVLNASQVKERLLDTDSTGKAYDEFMKTLKQTLKGKCLNAKLMSYGENIGHMIKKQSEVGFLELPGVETKFDLIKQGLYNGLSNYKGAWESDAANQYIQTTISDIKYGEVRKQGEDFLAANALKDGVQVTESGLQYEVVTMGKGLKPAATDKVKVHYEGTLIDGTVFDSSYQRGEPVVFGVNQVIAGWTEALQLMPVGSTFMLYIPQNLAYGERGAGQQIPPYSTLIFKVELLGIEK